LILGRSICEPREARLTSRIDQHAGVHHAFGIKLALGATLTTSRIARAP